MNGTTLAPRKWMAPFFVFFCGASKMSAQNRDALAVREDRDVIFPRPVVPLAEAWTVKA